MKGTAELHIPLADEASGYFDVVNRGIPIVSGFASLEKAVGQYQSINVPVRRLDDYGFTEVSFVKIDVEGHESSVLDGARETLFLNGLYC